MFVYHFKLAWLSVKKTPVLSALIVAAIGLGIGVCVTVLTVYALMTRDPAPDYSDQLFTYKLNNQPEIEDGGRSRPAYALNGYRDALNVREGFPSVKHSIHYQTTNIVQQQKAGQKAFTVDFRLTTSDFFPMHRTEFLYGTYWSEDDERSNPYLTVLTEDLNEQVFSGSNSVGQTIKIGKHFYQVVGVMRDFAPLPKYMETDSGPFIKVSGAFVPFSLTPELGLKKKNGDSRCEDSYNGQGGWQGYLDADCNWLHHWVELKSSSEVQQFTQFLDDYSESQRQYGRFLGPYDNEVHDVMSWLEDQQVVNRDYEFLLGVAFLFLVVCLLNCIGLMLTKFLSKAGEISLRRAVGASKKMIFKQHLIEIGVIGLMGGVVGLLVSLAGLAGVRSLYENYQQLTYLNMELIGIALLLAAVATLLAGVLPAWHACRLPASKYLKS